MQKNIAKYLSFCSVALLIVLMASATVYEEVYHNPLFFVLWAVAAISGLIWIIIRGVPRKIFTFGLHLSFIIILCGAMITHLMGERGRMHIRVGEESSLLLFEEGPGKNLPFSLRLEDFIIEYYKGSQAPADFRSVVTVLPDDQTYTISLNKILRYKGYRFYQADYDKDREGSILMVNHDPWGIGITYTGYALLLLSMIGFFFQKNSTLRSTFKRIAVAAVVVMGCLFSNSLESKEIKERDPKVLPDEVAEAFGDLYVYYNERVCPLSTLTGDYCRKAYGKASWGEFSANQTVTGWLFYYDYWRVVPFKLKEKERGTIAEEEKEYLRRIVSSGDAFRIFPIEDPDGEITWYNCNDPLPAYVLDDYPLWVFIRKSLDLIEESVRAQQWQEVIRIVEKIKLYQEKTAGAVLPSKGKIEAELLYNRISVPKVPAMIAITVGILLFLFCGIIIARKRKMPRSIGVGGIILLIIIGCYTIIVLALRWYVCSHVPLDGSYSVMMLMALLSCIIAPLLCGRFSLILPMGLLIAGFTMLVASIGSSNPQITHLMPVLQSPLLSIHVLSMMISYTLLGFVALCAIMGLCMPQDASEKLKETELVILYPALFLLIAGTFLGAVWANISWGTYWSWDPKETWALITLLVYSFPLHGESLKIFKNTKVFHAYCALAFLSVLITYFGVNLFLGGMHSYA